MNVLVPNFQHREGRAGMRRLDDNKSKIGQKFNSKHPKCVVVLGEDNGR